jgi:hypothetical protein
MWSLQSFNENSERRKAARKARDEHALDMAIANRDLFGPAYTGKGRRKDLGLLKKNRPAPMTDSNGNPYRPLKRGDLGMTTRQENALGDYNATRGPSKRPQ